MFQVKENVLAGGLSPTGERARAVSEPRQPTQRFKQNLTRRVLLAEQEYGLAR
jgi:hypothetical protein